MFDWVINTPLKGVLQNSCYQRSFAKSLKDTCKEKLLISFSLRKQSSMLKNYIFIKTEFIQRYFSTILLLSGIPYSFWKIERTPIWRNTS